MEPAWIEANREALLDTCRRADFILVIAGDGIDPTLERLARRFAGQDHPLNLSELVLVSMSLYELGDKFLLVPHVVSAVQRSERELTIKVVIQDVAERPVQADLTAERPSPLEVPRGAAMPVREEVGSFLRRLVPRLQGFLPDLKPPVAPRKSLDFVQKTTGGATIYYRIHFGGWATEGDLSDEFASALVEQFQAIAALLRVIAASEPSGELEEPA